MQSISPRHRRGCHRRSRWLRDSHSHSAVLSEGLIIGQSLSRLAHREETGGEPFAPVFPSFGQSGILFRRASVHLIAGVPGSFKSMLALKVMDLLNVPTLYFSSDSDFFTMGSRLLAMRTGKTTDETERILVEDKAQASDTLKAYEHVRWNYSPSPSLDDIWLEAYAYLEMFGRFPELVVIDIASDIDHQDGDEFATLRSLMREMKRFARDTGAGVIVVHHTTESVPGHPCQPRSAIMGKISQLPVLILNVALKGDRFYVAPVKNRFGRGPADASFVLEFIADGNRCLIEEKQWTPVPEPEPQHDYPEEDAPWGWSDEPERSWWSNG